MTLLENTAGTSDHHPHEAPGQQDFFRTMTYISGHRHPDTDSIVSAPGSTHLCRRSRLQPAQRQYRPW